MRRTKITGLSPVAACGKETKPRRFALAVRPTPTGNGCLQESRIASTGGHAFFKGPSHVPQLARVTFFRVACFAVASACSCVRAPAIAHHRSRVSDKSQIDRQSRQSQDSQNIEPSKSDSCTLLVLCNDSPRRATQDVKVSICLRPLFCCFCPSYGP